MWVYWNRETKHQQFDSNKDVKNIHLLEKWQCLKLTINCIGKQYTHAEQLCEIAMSLWPQSENSQI